MHSPMLSIRKKPPTSYKFYYQLLVTSLEQGILQAKAGDGALLPHLPVALQHPWEPSQEPSPPPRSSHHSPCILHHIKRQMDHSHVRGKTDRVKTEKDSFERAPVRGGCSCWG